MPTAPLKGDLGRFHTLLYSTGNIPQVLVAGDNPNPLMMTPIGPLIPVDLLKGSLGSFHFAHLRPKAADNHIQ